MTISPVRRFQKKAVRRLRALGLKAEMEWPSLAGTVGTYSPRLDIAVGPFATGDKIFSARYDSLESKYDELLAALFQAHSINLASGVGEGPLPRLEEPVPNRNARCFLAIEIENKVSRKHLMEGAINAAALGRYGVVVGWDASKIRALARTRAYLAFLGQVGKPTFQTANLVIVGRGQLQSALRKACRMNSQGYR